MEHVREQNKTHMPQREKGECPTAMETLRIGVICCLLDDDLTFCWGNSSFFDSIGYSRESFCSHFHDLRQYYAVIPDELTSIRRELTQAVDSGGRDIEMTIRLPLKEGGGFLVAALWEHPGRFRGGRPGAGGGIRGRGRAGR